MSSTKKTIAVVGATGNQGLSVVHTFLALPNWHVRALTRNPSSEKAQALSSAGAEVVQADLSDVASLTQAFENVHAIFVNTDFWETYRATYASGVGAEASSKKAYDTEVSRGKNCAVAASSVPTLERFVYSALASPKAASNGKLTHSFHAETKAAVVEYIEKEAPELAKKASYIYVGGYNTNAFLRPKLDPRSGQYTVIMPSFDIRIPIVDPVETTGPFVRVLIEEENAGVKLLAYNTDSYYTAREIIDLWSSVTGKPVSFVEMSVEAIHKQLGVELERIEMLTFLEEYGYCGGVENSIEPGQLKTKVVTKPYREWLKERDIKELL